MAHQQVVKAHATKSDKKPAAHKGKGKVRHVQIRQADNGGFLSTVHREPEGDTHGMYDMQPEENVFADYPSMESHMRQTFGQGQAAPAKKAIKPAAKKGKAMPDEGGDGGY